RLVQARALPADAAIHGDVDAFDLAVAGPGQSPDFIEAGPIERLFRAGKGDDGFGVDQPGEAARSAVRHQVGIFRGFLARMPWLVAELDPAQPFDVDVAFPARHHQPQRIALFGAQRLAVLRIDHETIVETFVERQAAVHMRAVGALDHRPFRFLLDADLFQQRRQPDAGPFGAPDHAVAE